MNNATASIGTGLKSIPQPPAFDSSIARLESLINSARTHSARAKLIADRFLGPEDQANKASSTAPDPSSILGKVEARMEDLNDTLMELDRQLARLETV